MRQMPDARRSGSGGGEVEVVAGCVEGDAELLGVAADLGEEEAALDAGHGGGGECGGVGVLAELAAGLHAGEAVAEVGFPAVEASGDRRSGFWVAFGELAGEGADWAAAARLLVDPMLDYEVEPAVDAAQESRWSRSSPCLPRMALVVTSMTARTRSSRSSK